MDATGSLSLLVGVAVLSLVTGILVPQIHAGDLSRNSLVGMRTKATLSSDEAWEVGHRASLRYLVFACIAGIVAIIAALGTFVFADVSSGAGEITLAAIPIAAFTGQIVAIIAGGVAADRAAKTV